MATAFDWSADPNENVKLGPYDLTQPHLAPLAELMAEVKTALGQSYPDADTGEPKPVTAMISSMGEEFDSFVEYVGQQLGGE